MEKDRRTTALFAAGDVPVHHEADIIEPVLPLQPLMTGSKRCLDRTVIGRMARRIAPQHISTNRPQGQARAYGPTRLRPKVAAKQPHRCPWGCAIAFALESRDARPSDGSRKPKRSSLNDGLALATRLAAHHNTAKTLARLRPGSGKWVWHIAHGVLLCRTLFL